MVGRGEMRYAQTGIILCTENYNACVHFYAELLDDAANELRQRGIDVMAAE